MKYLNLKKGPVFDIAPKRILFGKTEKSRKNHYKKQFDLIIKHWDQIPWRQWDVGSARNLSSLLREIGLGETVLMEREGKLLRCVDIVIVYIFLRGGRKWLTENPQEMYDGRIRNRRFPYISEKIRLGESPKDAALKAIREESGGVINAKLEKLIAGDTYDLDESHPYNTGSSSYPGLISHKHAYTFAYFIEQKEYRKKYIEIDLTGSVTEHSWKDVSENVWFSGTKLERKVNESINNYYE